MCITRTTNYTDTHPVINPITKQPNISASYRVRACNEYGWSSYSEPIHVNLIDKISCNPTLSSSSTVSSTTTLPSYSSYDMKLNTSLLPYGVTIPNTSTWTATTSAPTPTSRSMKSISRLLTSEERDQLLYTNMYSIPPTYHHSHEHLERETSIPTTTISTSSPSRKERKEKTTTGQLHDQYLDYGKNPQRHPDSTLAGETLHDVNQSLEQWLCRLADTCPIDETKKYEG